MALSPHHRASIKAAPLPLQLSTIARHSHNIEKKQQTQRSAMVPPRIKTSLLVFLFLFIYLFSSGIAEGISDNVKPIHSLHKEGVQMNSRKLLVVDAVLDYDYTGPNPKHDPRKGKPGSGGKNP